VGILKRLRGTPIARHTDAFDMRYNPQPPYNILSNIHIDFATMQRLNRFARYWDMIGNSGRFVRTRALLLADAPFERFLAFSDWMFVTTCQTHQIALDRLYNLVFDGITTVFGIDPNTARELLSSDYYGAGARGEPKFLRQGVEGAAVKSLAVAAQTTAKRQARHRRETAAEFPNG
jgi:hypothetical protein